MGDIDPAVKYNLDDHLGSACLTVTSDNGTVIKREESYPFGDTSFGSYGKRRYGSCWKERDEESVLHYYRERYYSPTCWYVNVDPLAGKLVFQSPFTYGDNNPVCKMDYIMGKDGVKMEHKQLIPLTF
jgi:RHS repeat-associated protein